MATSSFPSPNFPGPQPNWLARNWKWALVLGLIGLLLLFAAFVAGILLLVESSFQHSGCYTQALARARTNPQVAQKIGQPLQAGWLASGSINTSGGASGNANIAIPVSGPRGKGTLYLVAKKSADLWKFETLEVEVAGETERINLLQPEGNSPGEN